MTQLSALEPWPGERGRGTGAEHVFRSCPWSLALPLPSHEMVTGMVMRETRSPSPWRWVSWTYFRSWAEVCPSTP